MPKAAMQSLSAVSNTGSPPKKSLFGFSTKAAKQKKLEEQRQKEAAAARAADAKKAIEAEMAVQQKMAAEARVKAAEERAAAEEARAIAKAEAAAMAAMAAAKAAVAAEEACRRAALLRAQGACRFGVSSCSGCFPFRVGAAWWWAGLPWFFGGAEVRWQSSADGWCAGVSPSWGPGLAG